MATKAWGAKTDHFTAMTGSLSGTLVIQESEATPDALAVSAATDANGDTVEITAAGDKTVKNATCKYAIKDTLDLSDLKLGLIASGVIVQSISVSTAGGSAPTLAISGIVGAKDVKPPTGKASSFTLPAVDVLCEYTAQTLGGVDTVTGYLQSCNLEATCNVETINDGDGEPVSHGIANGMATITADIIAVDGSPDVTFTQGWTEVQGAGKTEPQADYHRTSVSAQKALERDAAAGGE